MKAPPSLFICPIPTVGALSDNRWVEFSQERYPKLDLIEPALNADIENGLVYVQDVLRRQRLLLTPEEWVRQHVLHWLLTVSRFPSTLLAVERQVGKSTKRADVVGYQRNGSALLLVECKSPSEPIDQETVRQAVLYNQTLHCRYIWLTNGLVHRVLEMEGEVVHQLPHLPDFGL